jgi:cobalt/nickel transport protein
METNNKSLKKFYAGFFLSAVFLAGLVSYYASSSPDGLEKVAEDQGFLETAKDSAVSGSPLADYGVAGIDNERLSVGASGVIGVLVTALVGIILFNLLKKRP